jgi:uncharacterized protein
MRIALVAACLAVASAAYAATPLPPRGDHAIYDAANVIDAPNVVALEALASELEAKAGVAMVIVTVPKLEGETADQLAVRVQHDWGVGKKGTDESIVIALAVADRKLFIATGYGSEGYLPDGKVGEIRDHVRAKLRANDFSGGLRQAAGELAAIAGAAHHVELTGVPPVASEPDSRTSDAISMLMFLVAFVIVAMMSRRRGGGGGGGLVAGALLGGALGGRDNGFGGGGDGGGFGGFGGGSGGGGGAGGDF